MPPCPPFCFYSEQPELLLSKQLYALSLELDTHNSSFSLFGEIYSYKNSRFPRLFYLAMIQYFRSACSYSLVFQDVAKFVHLLHGFFNMLRWEWLAAILFIKRPIFLMGVGLHFGGESRNNRIFRSANDHFFQRIPFVVRAYWTVGAKKIYLYIQ